MFTHQIHHLHTLHAHINSPQPNDTKMHTYIINIILKDTFYKDCSHLFKKFVNHNLLPISYKEALYWFPKYLNTTTRKLINTNGNTEGITVGKKIKKKQKKNNDVSFLPTDLLMELPTEQIPSVNYEHCSSC